MDFLASPESTSASKSRIPMRRAGKLNLCALQLPNKKNLIDGEVDVLLLSPPLKKRSSL